MQTICRFFHIRDNHHPVVQNHVNAYNEAVGGVEEASKRATRKLREPLDLFVEDIRGKKKRGSTSPRAARKARGK
jgi:hypothetical protein